MSKLMTTLARYRYSNCQREEPSFRIFCSPGDDRRRPADAENKNRVWPAREPIRPPEFLVAAKEAAGGLL
jgi:hypothetical protein